MAWAGVIGGGVSLLGGLFSDDNGAEGANDAAAEANRMQAQIGKEQWEYYKKIYQPLEEQYIKNAQGVGSIANQNRGAQQASADVAGGFAQVRERLRKQPGLQPGSQAALAEENRINLAEAATSAAGQSAARVKVQDKGQAALTDAVSLGKGLPATATSALGSGASGLAAAGRYGQTRADNAAAGFGKMVGGITQSDTFKNWVNGSSGATAVNAPGGSNFGADIGYNDPFAY